MNRRQIDLSENYNRAMSALIPARTETYSPIPHNYFLGLLDEEIMNTSDLRTTSKRLYTNGNGEQLIGFQTVNFRNIEVDPDFGLEMMLGFKNSYDKSMAAGLAAGASVMVCSNGVVAGDMLSFKRKHTGNAPDEMREKVSEAISLMRDDFSKLILEIDIMKDFNLTDKQKAEILGVMYFEENLVSPTQLSVIKHELKTSEHFRGDSAWDLYNNITESLKYSPPSHHIEDHIKLHKFMKNTIGIENIEEEIVETENVES